MALVTEAATETEMEMEIPMEAMVLKMAEIQAETMETPRRTMNLQNTMTVL